MEHVLDSKDIGLLESVLLPFDIYNDAADQSLRVLKQRFLYDEIEAEVNDVSTCGCGCQEATYSILNLYHVLIQFNSFGKDLFPLYCFKFQLSLQSKQSGFSLLHLDFMSAT